MIEQCLKHIIKQQSYDCCRNTCHHDFHPQHDLIHLNDRFRLVLELKRKNLIPEQDHDCHDRTKLYDDQKHLQKLRCTVKLYKLIQNNHVSGTADRKPLRDSLDNTKQDYL